MCPKMSSSGSRAGFLLHWAGTQPPQRLPSRPRVNERALDFRGLDQSSGTPRVKSMRALREANQRMEISAHAARIAFVAPTRELERFAHAVAHDLP